MTEDVKSDKNVADIYYYNIVYIVENAVKTLVDLLFLAEVATNAKIILSIYIVAVNAPIKIIYILTKKMI